MSFTLEQRDHFLMFLKSMDMTVGEKLPAREAGEFFSILTDYSVPDEDFEMKIALMFYKIPEMLGELSGSIKNLSIVREAMLDDSSENSDEARDLTMDFFNERIDEYWELAHYEDVEAENELNAAEKRRRNERKVEKRRMEKVLQDLQEERQNMFEIEREERRKLKEEKKNVEKSIQIQRQKEHDVAVEERKERRVKIEEEIAELQVQLQIQHDKESEERKERRAKKEKELIARQQKQQEEQEKQAAVRRSEKEEELEKMKSRQVELQAEQEKQAVARKAAKLREEQNRAAAIQAMQDVQSKERAARKMKEQGLGSAPVDIRSNPNGD